MAQHCQNLTRLDSKPRKGAGVSVEKHSPFTALTSVLTHLPSKNCAFLLLHEPELLGQSQPSCSSMRTSGLKGRAQRGSPAPLGPVPRIKIGEGAALEQPGRELCARGASSTAGAHGLPKGHVCCYILFTEEDTRAAVDVARAAVDVAQAAVPSVLRGLQFWLVSEDKGVHFSAL